MAMVVTLRAQVAGRRGAVGWTTIGILIFLGVTALAGGLALVFELGAAPPQDWLDRIPLIGSWVIPGLVLAIGFGFGSLLVAYGMLRRYRWSWLATVLIGLAHLGWIGIELVYLPQPSALQVVYGLVGLALVLLPWHPSVRTYLLR
jgi:hypothetical protein